MGQIEQYWTGITAFNVEFVSFLEDDSKRTHRKVLVFSGSVSKDDVFVLVSIYFKNIYEVLHVDEIDEGLYLKEK